MSIDKGLGLRSPVADGGVAHILDTVAGYTGGKLLSLRTGGVEKASLSALGELAIAGAQLQFRIAEGAGSPNIVAGYVGNSIAAGVNVRANAILAGGYVGGGPGSAPGVGGLNWITGPETRYATIAGGYDNGMDGEASTTDIDCAASTIGGGAHHRIKCTHATISGGSYGMIEVGADYSGIGSGTGHTISAGAQYGRIGGGQTHTIGAAGSWATIAGGASNSATKAYATVGGGHVNTAGGVSSGVGSGYNNNASGDYAYIPGGNSCVASGQGALAFGRKAQATGDGSMVLADFVDAIKANAVVNSALLKFDGGIRLVSVAGTSFRIADDGLAPAGLVDIGNPGTSDTPGDKLLLRLGGNRLGMRIPTTDIGVAIDRYTGGAWQAAPLVFWDRVNGRVGIGTATPKAALHVVGLPTYADNAAAIGGGLTAGAFYRTAAGAVMVVY